MQIFLRYLSIGLFHKVSPDCFLRFLPTRVYRLPCGTWFAGATVHLELFLAVRLGILLPFLTLGMSCAFFVKKETRRAPVQPVWVRSLDCMHLHLHMRWVLEEGHFLISMNPLSRIMRVMVSSVSSHKRCIHLWIPTLLTWLQHQLLPRE